MEKDQKALPEGNLPVRLPKPPKKGWKFFLSLLLCGALFVAAFGLALLLQTKNRIPAFLTDWIGETSKNEQLSTPTENQGETKEDPKDVPKEEVGDEQTVKESLPQGAILIRKECILGEKSLQNRSVYLVDEEKLTPPVPKEATGEDPLVLILCTRGSESYAEGEYILSPAGDAIFSQNADQSVLAVAEALAKSLCAKGIKTIFCNTRHDDPNLIGSYRRAGESVASLLAEYPGIEYVIDLHREELFAPDGSLVGCIAENEGNPCAQISILVGSDGDGSPAYSWEENLALAKEIGERLNESCPGIFRSVTLENSPYNQNLGGNSLLLKIGAAGNSLEEAKRSAELFAKVFSDYLS